VRAKLVEQERAEHHVAVLAVLATLDVNHHASAINVAEPCRYARNAEIGARALSICESPL
jgi:hypothetical protein